MKPEFIMLIGIPGSGKTEWLKKYKSDTYIVVSPDKIREDMTGYISNQDINTEVWEKAYSRIIGALNKGLNVILDATNVNTVYRRGLLRYLPECKLIAKVFEIGPDEAFKRIQKAIKDNENRGIVPEHIVYRHYGDFLYTKEVLKSEGFEVEFID